ncbi:Uncharacterised protein [Mycobacteroides abscessus subsp. abscessus]|nr:Uncharacterised protein [Mycobacteroides abscessus subsp. abscessus]
MPVLQHDGVGTGLCGYERLVALADAPTDRANALFTELSCSNGFDFQLF